MTLKIIYFSLLLRFLSGFGYHTYFLDSHKIVYKFTKKKAIARKFTQTKEKSAIKEERNVEELCRIIVMIIFPQKTFKNKLF